ncbi:murein biosynthesis integral membrane protein MurJ [Pradoshia eiseniae]|uniref:Probable lipid II flippase MurJ n=1 Tax=Pradoshia eiseniae TaxID=2064768 RepID=A0A2S7N2H4_9BACI|nr:murein biosynthesis integral membrane protein MurJ [Pradoshia eiseniae]PQD96180.1 murein biosynthesis integral membrane protein MurJ [Pradoshia eiseniae]
MKKTTILLMLITLLSGLIGFGREIALSYFYGASNISDAYIISTTIPMVIFGFVGAGITVGYIPMYSKIENRSGELAANNFTSNLITVICILFTIVVLGTLIFTEPVVTMFASGFQGETLNIATNLTRISIFTIYFTGMVSIFSGYLQIKRNYIIPALVGFPLNIITIIFMFISTKTDITILAVGSVIAGLFQLIFILPFIIKKKYKYRVLPSINNANIKSMAAIALPAIIGISAYQINYLVDRTLASNIISGGISAINYSSRIIGFIQGILASSIIAVVYPIIASFTAKNEIGNLKNSISSAVKGINVFIIPATFGLMVYAQPIVELLYGRGAFDKAAIDLTTSALFFYSLGLIGLSLREILSRTFYALQDSKTPTINAIIAVILNIILNIILSKFMGISGLALASSISAILGTLLLFYSLRKKIGPFGMRDIIKSFIKVVVASFLMATISNYIYKYLSILTSSTLALIVSVTIGIISYLLIAVFFKIEDVNIILNNIRVKFFKKKN